jgi:hypothetical protein
MSSYYDHRLDSKTTLGVGISAPGVYSWHDAPKDYADFTQMYSRWLAGPRPFDPSLSFDAQRDEDELNFRIFGSARPSLADLAAMGWYPNSHPGPLGLWDIQRFDMTGIDPRVAEDGALLNAVIRAARQLAKGVSDIKLPNVPIWLFAALRPEALAERTLSEVWARNIVTDNGALAMLKNTWYSSGSQVTIMDYILISFNNQAYAVQTGATINTGSGAQTTIACAGGVQFANFGATKAITWSYGTANAETWTTASGSPGNIGATSITVGSQTAGAVSHIAGDSIVPQPTTSDNPSSLTNAASSGALPSGDFAYSGAGAGLRQVVISYTFSVATAAGEYTEAYTANATSMAANASASHLIFPPQTINNTTSLAFTLTEKV